MPVITVSAKAGQISDYVKIYLPRWSVGNSLICYVDSVITGTYTVEVSNDGPVGPAGLISIPAARAPGVVRWVSQGVLQTQSAAALSNLAYPVQWVRLNGSALLSGQVSLSVAQCF